MFDRKMKLFLVLIAAHWVEHLFQAYQVYVQHLHRECALGFLGMKYPWLVRTESLHFGFAVFTLLGIHVLAYQFIHGDSWTAWFKGYLWSIWHVFEHTLLFMQAIFHHNFFGKAVPTSVIQLIFPRIELHLFYNSIITYYILRALYLEYKNQVYVPKGMNRVS